MTKNDSKIVRGVLTMTDRNGKRILSEVVTASNMDELSKRRTALQELWKKKHAATPSPYFFWDMGGVI